MRTTIDIPDDLLRHTMSLTGASTKREAIITALEDYNRRQRMAALATYLGTCEAMIRPDELERLRSEPESRP